MMRAATLCTLVASTLAQTHPDFTYEYSDYSRALRASLLSTYDKRSPPKSTRTGDSTSNSGPSRAGAEVSVQIRFFKAKEVDLYSGFMTLKVWYRLSWTDHRLAWNETAFNGISQVPLDQSEIWQPDIGHYNAMAGELGQENRPNAK